MIELNYGRMMQRALQSVVAETLSLVAEEGLPGEHHFYITVMTSHPGVEMPKWLRDRHPEEEILIVLQYEFEELTVDDDAFSVVLSFGGEKAKLTVPFDAILQFADPSAEFGLRFEPLEPEEPEAVADADATLEQLRDIAPRGFRRPADEPETEETASDESDADEGEQRSGEVVSLDAFRKKP